MIVLGDEEHVERFRVTGRVQGRARALLAFARRHDAVVVEDDYDGEFRYEGSPLEALRTAGSEESVCYVGTFSKSMLPSLRLGFVVATAWLLPALTTARNCSDWHSPVPVQMAVAEFIGAGHLLRHVRKVREIYAARRALLLAALRREFSAHRTPVASWYGMHVAAEGIGRRDLEAVSERLRRRGVHLHGLQRYCLKGGARDWCSASAAPACRKSGWASRPWPARSTAEAGAGCAPVAGRAAIA